jgi:catechol 2,3-dioxygenase-like lactoylglutathione lyase family enzyme
MNLSLNHFSIRTLDLTKTRHFYTDVLGFVDGPRPPFPFPGIWLYAGGTGDYANAVVHVIGLDPQDPNGLNQYLGERDNTGLHGSGAVDHLAFFATGLPEMMNRLRAADVPYRAREVPVLGLHQVFVDDPNGIVIELNFPAEEGKAIASH